MSTRVLRLLADYFQRTLGLWPLLATAHVMQLTAFWATHVDRLPLLGTVMASLAYCAAFDSPHAVLRTLPLSRADIVLFRWWASIGAPALLILVSTALAWLVSAQNGWARPSQEDVMLYALLSCALLGVLAAAPLPVRHAGRANWGMFGLIWGALGAVGFYGVPALPPLAMKIVIALGLGLSLAAYVRAWLGRVTQMSLPTPALPRRPKLSGTRRLRGWAVILAEVARSSAVLSIIAIVGTTCVRWIYPVLDGVGPLAWLFVSAIAVGASLLTRRWMNAVRSLRLLPIGEHRLTFILYGMLIAPGSIACLMAMVAWHLSPRLGLDLPGYMFVVFLVAPVTLVPWQQQRHAAAATSNSAQEWAPLMQQAAWPMWVGAVCSFGAPNRIASVYVPALCVVAVAFAAAGYCALFAGIRSPHGLERTG